MDPDEELRLECAKLAAGLVHDGSEPEVIVAAQKLYDFVKATPAS